MMTILLLFQTQGGGNLLFALLPWILIFGVFYLLIIVPQRRRQRDLQNTISNLKTGDKVITSGGIIGTITAVRDTSLLIRSADKSIIEVARSSVSGLQAEEEKKS
ncbi:MAG: preprotein translocase subunit YajC [Acidobacteria bacterium 13_1_20CM_3_53_8]|nr:MAG: preprotein translocase subunit YajC [Acidobacteria bacterium 13_1_20CM_3_53_8]